MVARLPAPLRPPRDAGSIGPGSSVGLDGAERWGRGGTRVKSEPGVTRGAERSGVPGNSPVPSPAAAPVVPPPLPRSVRGSFRPPAGAVRAGGGQTRRPERGRGDPGQDCRQKQGPRAGVSGSRPASPLCPAGIATRCHILAKGQVGKGHFPRNSCLHPGPAGRVPCPQSLWHSGGLTFGMKTNREEKQRRWLGSERPSAPPSAPRSPETPGPASRPCSDTPRPPLSHRCVHQTGAGRPQPPGAGRSQAAPGRGGRRSRRPGHGTRPGEGAGCSAASPAAPAPAPCQPSVHGHKGDKGLCPRGDGSCGGSRLYAHGDRRQAGQGVSGRAVPTPSTPGGPGTVGGWWEQALVSPRCRGWQKGCQATGHGASSRGTFWGGRPLSEPQAWLDEETLADQDRGGSLDTFGVCRDGEAGGFPAGKEEAHLLGQPDGITCGDDSGGGRGCRARSPGKTSPGTRGAPSTSGSSQRAGRKARDPPPSSRPSAAGLRWAGQRRLPAGPGTAQPWPHQGTCVPGCRESPQPRRPPTAAPDRSHRSPRTCPARSRPSGQGAPDRKSVV